MTTLLAPLARLLGLLGEPTECQVLLDAFGHDFSLARMCAQLRERGHNARCVRWADNDLSWVPVPALFELHTGVALVTRVTARSIEIDQGVSQRLRVPRSTFLAGATGGAVVVEPSAVVAGSFLQRLLRAMRQRSKLVAKFVVGGLLWQLCELSVPLASRHVMDEVLPQGAAHQLTLVAAAGLLILLHAAWIGFWRLRVLRSLDAQLQFSLLSSVFTHILNMPLRLLRGKTVGDMTQLMRSAQSLTALATTSALVPLTNGVAAFSGILMLAQVSAALAAAVAGMSLIMIALSVHFALRYAAAQSSGLRAAAKQRTRLFELLSGVAVVQASVAARTLLARWLGDFADEQAAGVRRLRAGLKLELLFQGMTELVTVGALLWTGQLCLNGQLSLGSMVASFQHTHGFMAAMIALGHAALPLVGARADLENLSASLQLESKPAPEIRARRVAQPACELVLSDVWFRYNADAPWILRGYSLQVQPGTTCELTGASGAGKTTILRLLAGLYEPERGSALVDGRDARAARDRIAFIPQDTYLYEGSILHNLQLLSGASLARIADAAELTGLSELLATLPMGLHTMLPPGARTLSGGQRQLIILTACVASPKPVLLLDEAMANLDRLTQARLVGKNLFEGKTVVSVVHDRLSIRSAQTVRI